MTFLSKGTMSAQRARKRDIVLHAKPPRISTVFLIFLLLCGADLARAGHPLGTEEAGTVGRKTLELEFNFEADKRGKDWQYSLGNILTLGIAEPLDFSIEYEYLFVEPRTGSSIDGFGDTGLFLKYSKPPPNRGDTRAGIKLGGIFPTGDEIRGTGSGAKDYEVRLIMEREKTPYLLSVNLSYRFAGNRPGGVSPDDVFGASLAVIQEPAGKGATSPVAEVEYRTPDFPGQDDIYSLLGGFILTLSETSALSFGVKWGIQGDVPDVLFTSGMTLRF